MENILISMFNLALGVGLDFYIHTYLCPNYLNDIKVLEALQITVEFVGVGLIVETRSPQQCRCTVQPMKCKCQLDESIRLHTVMRSF
jgi:hypothetical protein